jgi:sugar phosphate isomerase/epimerase
MSNTKTGQFTIGFRRMGWKWQENLAEILSWAHENGFGAVNLGRDGAPAAKAVIKAGLRLGSIDLPEWQGMLAPDKTKRAQAIARNSKYIQACSAAIGPANYFLVMLPEQPTLPPIENFKAMVASFAELAPVLEKAGGRLVIEGWPGPGALCCTPEGYRAFFKECPFKSLGVNYDPSHLIRMQIDPLRFLDEFADRVFHIHGKDTEILTENLYEYGIMLPPIFVKNEGAASMHWRYTIPGYGCMRWSEAFRRLESHGYKGCVSIEHEDNRFSASEQDQKFGLIVGRQYLEGC